MTKFIRDQQLTDAATEDSSRFCEALQGLENDWEMRLGSSGGIPTDRMYGVQ